MDLSKLPKLSDTAANTPPPPPEAVAPVLTPPIQQSPHRPTAYPQPGIGADVWISVVLGILFLSMGSQFARYAVAKMKGQSYDTGMLWPVMDPPDSKGGTAVSYYDLQGFQAYTETGEFLFGLTLLFDAAAKTATVTKPGRLSRSVLTVALLETLSAVMINLYTASKFFSTNSGTPLISLLIIAFGGWILLDQVHTLRLMRPITTRA